MGRSGLLIFPAALDWQMACIRASHLECGAWARICLTWHRRLYRQIHTCYISPFSITGNSPFYQVLWSPNCSQMFY